MAKKPAQRRGAKRSDSRIAARKVSVKSRKPAPKKRGRTVAKKIVIAHSKPANGANFCYEEDENPTRDTK